MTLRYRALEMVLRFAPAPLGLESRDEHLSWFVNAENKNKIESKPCRRRRLQGDSPR